MNEITVELLARKAGLSTEDLLKKISEAGLSMSSKGDTLDTAQQQRVLAHIRQNKKKLGLKLKKPISLKKSTKKEELHDLHSVNQHNRDLDARHKAPEKSTLENNPKSSLESTPEAPAKKKAETKKKESKQKAAPTENSKPLSVEEVLASRTKKVDKNKKIESKKDTEDKKKETSKPNSDPIELSETMSIEELSQKINTPTTEIIRMFFDLGEMVTINQIISFELAEIVCENIGIKTSRQAAKSTQEDLLSSDTNAEQDIRPRSAIVTIMGHVDHGKTTLLDTIRKTKIAEREAGGITQHIGAYKVTTNHGDITFLDTPGHESFTAMRARGAKVTDIVVLVVAANDGVMPQTIEAIQHAKAASAPIIVAINKIDKEDADIERIKTDLSQHGLAPEDWGGDTICQSISAKTGQGIDDLLDSIALQAEMLDLKADYAGRASGTVIESNVDIGLGPVATILVQSGTFKTGAIVLIDEFYGKIRVMYDHTRKKKTYAEPSDTIEITGLSGIPKAGDLAIALNDEKEARAVASRRRSENKLKERVITQNSKGDIFLRKMDDKISQQKELSIIIKSDVHGSLEAIIDIINKINNTPEVKQLKIKKVAYTVGGINSSDIHLATASNAMIIAFNVRADASARKLQSQEKVKIEYFSTVYDIYDYLMQVSKDILTPETSEKIIGTADVKEVFRTSKQITISGCIVTEGSIRKNGNVRLLRDQKSIYTGKIQSLRRFQDEVTEVKKDLECGIGIKGYTDVQPGDTIEAYIVEKNSK